MDIFERKSRVTDQITRLQQQQIDLVQQTARELETLKQQIQEDVFDESRIAQEREPLLAEIRALRTHIQHLEYDRSRRDRQLAELEHQFHFQYRQLTETLSSFGSLSATVSKVNPVRIEPLEPPTLRYYPADIPDKPAQPEPVAETPKTDQYTIPIRHEVPAAPVVEEEMVPQKKKFAFKLFGKKKAPKEPVAKKEVAQEIKKEPLKEKVVSEEPRPKKKGGLVRRLATLVILGGIGYGGWTAFQHTFGTSTIIQKGVVAGASTDSKVIPEEQTMQKAPPTMENAIWEVTNDPNFGIRISYDKNATELKHTTEGNNFWFVEEDPGSGTNGSISYIMKITKLDAEGKTLDAWVNDNKADYQSEYTPFVRGTFGTGFGAWTGSSLIKDENAGTLYFVLRGSNIYIFWVKNVPPTSDQGQRLARMVSSLQFTD